MNNNVEISGLEFAFEQPLAFLSTTCKFMFAGGNLWDRFVQTGVRTLGGNCWHVFGSMLS